MSPDNLVALGIFGTAALALIAGLGAWIWEIVSSRKSQPPSETVLPPTDKPTSALKKVETQHPPEVKTGSKLPASRTITLQPQPPTQAKESEPLPVVEKFDLVKEVVESDPSYQESLANVLEVDPPEVTPEVTEPSPAAQLKTEDFLSCSGTAFWQSEAGNQTHGNIKRAIFRDGFQSLRLTMSYGLMEWPKEIALRRDTSKAYSGQAGNQFVNIHCSLIFENLTGKALTFEGLWYAYRTDTERCELFLVTGQISPSQGDLVLPPPIGTPRAVGAPAPPPAPEPVQPISIPGRRFSLGRGSFRGNPFLEILENGSPWGDSHPGAQRHFSFGKRKARMVLTARKQIRAFVDNAGRNVTTLNAQVDADPWLDGSITVSGQEFFRVGQREIRRPFLKLTHGEESFSFGLSKAEALDSLMSEIEAWAKPNITS